MFLQQNKNSFKNLTYSELLSVSKQTIEIENVSKHIDLFSFFHFSFLGFFIVVKA